MPNGPSVKRRKQRNRRCDTFLLNVNRRAYPPGDLGLNGPADASDDGPAARLRAFEADSADLRRRAVAESGDAISGAAPIGAEGMDCVRVGRLGGQPAGEVLPAHRLRSEAGRAGVGRLESHGRNDAALPGESRMNRLLSIFRSRRLDRDLDDE